MTGATHSTAPSASLSGDGVRDAGAELLALIVLWSRHEPQRIGEVLLVPDDGADAPWIFGRGEASSRERRVILLRQRPGTLEASGPVECPRISRAQLRLWRHAPGALAIERIGRCAMVVGGRDADRATIRPGEIVELRNEMLFLCAVRPSMLPAGVSASHPFGAADAHGIVGESPAAWRLRGAVIEAARRAGHALVLGPSGTGKELVAQALHAQSDRGARLLTARNAATIPDGLVDPELFGNVRNYPNPGTPERPGLIGQADGSTLLLDEIGELPLASQAHLLRVLDDGEYHRLGEAVARRADLRLVGATNRPESALKHDLLARLAIRITVPGLDERCEDVPLVAVHLLRHRAAADPSLAKRFFEGAWPRFSPALMSALVLHAYTTHVRELDALLVCSTLESTGRYLELTSGVRRRLTFAQDARAAAASADAFTADERTRLELQRAHRFRATDCGRDPAYPGNRQTADLHLRHLACRALQAAAWDVGAAAALLAGGDDDDLARRARERIDTFLDNLERRLAAAPPGEAGRGEVIAQWRGEPALITPVVDALQAGMISGAEPPGTPTTGTRTTGTPTSR
jgi:two-component system nitrogen regulation response regulator GlnG/two-component system response regulator HydG